MKGKLSTYTFLDNYEGHIRPAINQIDLYLRTATEPLDIADVACVLDVSEREITSLLAKIDCKTITKAVFMSILSHASSRICRLYQREIKTGSPPTYTAAQIAYIYGLDVGLVKNACAALKIKEATAFTLPLLFAQIPYAPT